MQETSSLKNVAIYKKKNFQLQKDVTGLEQIRFQSRIANCQRFWVDCCVASCGLLLGSLLFVPCCCLLFVPCCLCCFWVLISENNLVVMDEAFEESGCCMVQRRTVSPSILRNLANPLGLQ